MEPSGSRSLRGRGNGYAESCSPESRGPFHCGSRLSARFGLVRVTTSQACVRLPTPRFLAQRAGRSGLGFSTLPLWFVPFPRLSRVGTRGGPSRVHLQGESCPHSDSKLSEREETSFFTLLVLPDTPRVSREQMAPATPERAPIAPRRASALRAEAEKRRRAARCWLSARSPQPFPY